MGFPGKLHTYGGKRGGNSCVRCGMAALLGEWLHSLQLAHSVTSFERDLSNGVVFGEVLVALGFAPEDLLTSLTDAHSVRPLLGFFLPPCRFAICIHVAVILCMQSATKMENFKTLQQYFHSAGVALSAKDIREIMTEQRSSATKVLYQLRMLTEPKAPPARDPEPPTGWKREPALGLVDDPAKRSDMEFIKKAIASGTSQ